MWHFKVDVCGLPFPGAPDYSKLSKNTAKDQSTTASMSLDPTVHNKKQ